MSRTTLFDRYPKTTLTVLLTLLLGLTLIGIDWVAGRVFGLGKVVQYEAHPIYGYRLAPNQQVARNSHQRVLINNLGLRANTNWSITSTQIPNASTSEPTRWSAPTSILFIGDSVTYGGSYIDNEQLFSEQIAKALPNYQIGNAGVNGWGVDNVVAFIKDTGFLHADIYVLMFPEGDFYRGLSRIGGQPFWTRQPYFALEELWQYGIYKAHLKKTPDLHRYENDPTQRKIIAQLAVEHLKGLVDYLQAHDKKVLVYISPSLPQVLGDAQPDPIIKTLLSQYGISAIYLNDRFDSLSTADKTALFHDVIHLSDKGHTRWAELMLPDIQSL